MRRVGALAPDGEAPPPGSPAAPSLWAAAWQGRRVPAWPAGPAAGLAGQFHGHAEVPGQQPRAVAVLGAERARGAGEADVVQRPLSGGPSRRASLIRLPPGPGQLGGPGAGRVEPATQDLPDQPHRAVKVTDVILDQVQAGPAGPARAAPAAAVPAPADRPAGRPG